jgi:hypothetical protein
MIINEHLRLLSSGPHLLIASLNSIGYRELNNSFTQCFIVACMFQIKGSSITAVDGLVTFGMSDSDRSIIKYWNILFVIKIGNT